MQTPIYWIELESPGRLGISARPRGGDWLRDEMQAWRDAGIHHVVSLLTPTEAHDLGLEAEGEACRLLGMSFMSLPIPDRGVPDSLIVIKQFVARLADALAHGESIVVHCRQGIGRSALVAASVLAALGISLATALQLIATARGVHVPETFEQEKWLEAYAPGMATYSPAVIGRRD